MKANLRELVDGTQTLPSRVFDWFFIVLIVFSVVALAVETLPDLSAKTQRFLQFAEWVIVLLFTVEFALRIYVAERKMRFLTSFYGLIDLIAIAPFYIALALGIGGYDLRGARVIRLLRIVRLLKIARYNSALDRLVRAFQIAWEELVLYLIITAFMLYISAVGIYYCEHLAQPDVFKSVFHSLWWAVTTLTTVGYGDVYPVTLGGRIFTFVILMIGLGIVAVPAGLLASAMSQVRREDAD